MSWRTLLVFLLLAAVASWQGGIQLGEWLVSRAPESIATAGGTKDSKDQVLDANGKPFTPQPPQPRVDGTLGVPRASAPVEWTITPVLASLTDVGTTAMAVDSEGNYERRDSELAAGGAELATSQNDVATLDVATSPARTPPPATPTRPTTASPDIEGIRTSTNTDPTKAPVITVYSWTQSLKKKLNSAQAWGFFNDPLAYKTPEINSARPTTDGAEPLTVLHVTSG